jgi:hypothetical protein
MIVGNDGVKRKKQTTMIQSMQIAQVSHYKMNTSSFCKTMSCDLGKEHFSALLLEYFHHAVRSKKKKKECVHFSWICDHKYKQHSSVNQYK